MHLYHHAFSMNSQKVRLALEEKGLAYISHSMNPLEGKDLDPNFFRVNASGKIPVVSFGSHIMIETHSTIKFIDALNDNPLGGGYVDRDKVEAWVQRVNEWSPKLFTQSHVPERLRRYVTRFKRRVAMARMGSHPELAAKYRAKLHGAYATEEMLKDGAAVEANERQLVDVLDAAERQLASSDFLVGGRFTMADAVLIPVLARLELLNLWAAYVHPRPRLAEYWARMKQRPAYLAVIGKYFSGLNRYKTLLATAVHICLRDVFRRY